MPTGEGTIHSKEGNVYYGSVKGFLHNSIPVIQKHGPNGLETKVTGEHYIGEFIDDVRCGKGLCYYPNGEMYYGNFFFSLNVFFF